MNKDINVNKVKWSPFLGLDQLKKGDMIRYRDFSGTMQESEMYLINQDRGTVHVKRYDDYHDTVHFTEIERVQNVGE